MHKDLKNVLLSEEDIQNICKEMGAIITEGIIKIAHSFVLVF